jgi:hypothetical protein
MKNAPVVHKGTVHGDAVVHDAEVIPSWKYPTAPSWDRARELCADLRKTVDNIILLGLEISALRKQFFRDGQGAGGGNFSNSSKIPRLSRDSDVQHCLRGWQAKVREELGMSHVTALEVTKRARYCCMIRDLAIGESVQYLNAKKEVQNVEPTPEMSDLAKAALEDVASGHASPSRSWAGITGEGTRVKKGASMKREEVDHSRNIRDGLIKLKTSLRHWKKLDPAQRAELEVIWGDVVKHVPETWLA